MKYTIKKWFLRKLINTYHWLGLDIIKMRLGFYDQRIERSISNLRRNNDLTNDDLRNDIINCYKKYLVSPEEYFLLDFEGKDDFYRASFLSDSLRNRLLFKHCSEKQFIEELSDKYQFYQLAKKYFGRDAILVEKGSNLGFTQFYNFIKKHSRVFVKPLTSCCGRGAYVLETKDVATAKKLYYNMLNEGGWMVEELIVQSPDMAIWNCSSVNTVRLPCFNVDGKIHLLSPFLRTGRKGSIVDNGGAGGVLASIDASSGVVTSDGIDEQNHVYCCHPDSGVQFKNWQVPKWSELIDLAGRVYMECFPCHKYIGFDFALTEKGWIIIEGNWGQFLGQFSSKEGIKDKFMEYMSIKVNKYNNNK